MLPVVEGWGVASQTPVRDGTVACSFACVRPTDTRASYSGANNDVLSARILEHRQRVLRPGARTDLEPERLLRLLVLKIVGARTPCDMQGRPSDSDNLVLVYAAPRSRTLSFQYHEDGGDHQALRFGAMSLRTLG